MEDVLSPDSGGFNDPFNISESLVPARETKQAGQSNVSFDGLLQRPLLLKEDLKEGCGGQLWPAGMVLAKYMLRQHRSSLVDKTMSVLFYHLPIFSARESEIELLMTSQYHPVIYSHSID